jgi:hypothetical protein
MAQLQIIDGPLAGQVYEIDVTLIDFSKDKILYEPDYSQRHFYKMESSPGKYNFITCKFDGAGDITATHTRSEPMHTLEREQARILDKSSAVVVSLLQQIGRERNPLDPDAGTVYCQAFLHAHVYMAMQLLGYPQSRAYDLINTLSKAAKSWHDEQTRRN